MKYKIKLDKDSLREKLGIKDPETIDLGSLREEIKTEITAETLGLIPKSLTQGEGISVEDSVISLDIGGLEEVENAQEGDYIAIYGDDGHKKLLLEGLIQKKDGKTVFVGGPQSDLAIDDEGSLLTAGATEIDFVGAGVTATAVGTKVTVTIAGTDTFAAIQVDGVTQNDAVPTLDFDGTDFTLTESPADDFDITIKDSGIDHDATTNFVANEHIDHTSVVMAAGEGISGGGDISTSRSFDLDLSGLTTLTAIASGDKIPFTDVDDGNANKNITFTNFEATINHDNLTGFVGDEHVPHSSVTLTAGVGLSGGGDISASRTFDVDLNELTTETSIASGDFIAMVDITDSGSGKITFANFEGTLNLANLTGTLDISTQSNLAVTSPIVLTDDTLSLDTSAVDHGGLGGLADDDHTQYLLLAGRAGGQIAIGGTGAGDDLTLQSTSNVTKGTIFLGSASAYDEVNDRLGIGTTTPSKKLAVLGGTIIDGSSDEVQLTVQANSTQTADLVVFERSDGTDLFTFRNSGTIEMLVTDRTYTATPVTLLVDSTVTLDHVNAAINAFKFAPTIVYEQAAASTGSAVLFQDNSTQKNVATEANALGLPVSFQSNPIYQADSQIITQTASIAFNADPTWNIAGGGTLTNAAHYNFMVNAPLIDTGATVTNFFGFYYGAPTVSGTSTNQYAFYAKTPTASTLNYAYYSEGGEVHFNDSGGDWDFTVEASGVTDALVIDGATGAVKLGELTAGFVKSDALGNLTEQATIDISADTNLAVTSPITLTGDTVGLDQGAVDHGSIGGLTDDDHTQYLLATGARTGATSSIQPFTNGIRLTAKAGTTTDGDLWNDSTQKSLQMYVASLEQSIDGTFFTQTADATVSNTSTETSIIGTGVGTTTLPANSLVAGKTIRITLWGYYERGSGNLRFRFLVGGSAFASTGIATPAATTSAAIGIKIEIDMTCRTTGATGTVYNQGRVTFNTSSLLAHESWAMTDTATDTIDTTASNSLDVAVRFGTAGVGNNITITNCTMQVLN